MKGNDRKRTFFADYHSDSGIIFVFNTLPLIKGFIYSFTNFKGYGSYDWVGLRNYIDLFSGRKSREILFVYL